MHAYHVNPPHAVLQTLLEALRARIDRINGAMRPAAIHASNASTAVYVLHQEPGTVLVLEIHERVRRDASAATCFEVWDDLHKVGVPRCESDGQHLRAACRRKVSQAHSRESHGKEGEREGITEDAHVAEPIA
jgi:hypothetical protein